MKHHRDERTMTVHVPLTIRRRGGRKLVLAPDGTQVAMTPVTRHIDNAMVKALARAFRWRHLLESGTYGTIEDIAATEKINASYVSRILRMTLLAPDIVEAILEGRQAETMTLARLMKGVPSVWAEQNPVFARLHTTAGHSSGVTQAAEGDVPNFVEKAKAGVAG